MSENLAAWHRPHLGKVQTQVMPAHPAGDLLLDLIPPQGGRLGDAVGKQAVKAAKMTYDHPKRMWTYRGCSLCSDYCYYIPSLYLNIVQHVQLLSKI